MSLQSAPACLRCSGDQVVVAGDGELARARRCGCAPRCSICLGSGWVTADGRVDGHGRRRRCGCSTIDRRIGLWNSARVPARYAACTLASFMLRGDTAATRAAVCSWASAPLERGLLLHGPVGRGKTHLVVAALRALVFERGQAARYAHLGGLYERLRGSFAGGDIDASTVLEDLVLAPVLALDELGIGRGTEWEVGVLEQLIARRYDRGAGVLLATTNLLPTASGVDALGERIGARAWSRLQEMTTPIAAGGVDYRGAVQ
jgi:DNA replication protein DnaC